MFGFKVELRPNTGNHPVFAIEVLVYLQVFVALRQQELYQVIRQVFVDLEVQFTFTF